MADYSYPLPTADLGNVALAVERALSLLPNGVTANSTAVSISFSTALTAPQKATLDTVMADANVGKVPVTANSVYTIDDFMDLRAQLKTELAAFGLTFKMYLSGSKVTVVFDKVLTNSEKNNLKNTVLTYLKQTQ